MANLNLTTAAADDLDVMERDREPRLNDWLDADGFWTMSDAEFAAELDGVLSR